MGIFRRACAMGVVAAAAVAPLVATGGSQATAAFRGVTRFQIDGNTAGPDDWDELPPGVGPEPVAWDDPCAVQGSNIDPDQLDGKLDALDLAAPTPTPGNVTKKADLCRMYRAVEYPQVNGREHVVVYGGWERPAGNRGEVTVFFPLVGAEPGKADDLLVAFEYDNAAGGSTRGRLWRWTGSRWAPQAITAGFQAAVDDTALPSFGEFALDLTTAGLVRPNVCAAYELSYVFTRTGQENANGELQDYAGGEPVSISNCGRLEITKEAVPEPSVATGFGFQVTSVGGGAVDATTGAHTLSGTLTVPGQTTYVNDHMALRDDLHLGELEPPAGWDVWEIACDVTDFNGNTTRANLVTNGVDLPGATFAVLPGGVTRCTITNFERATLTIVKVAQPVDGTDFPFTTTGPGLNDFTLDVDGDPAFDDHITFTDLVPGTPYTVTEVTPPAPWNLLAIDCLGASNASTDTSTLTASITMEPGEHVVCAFTNGTQPVTTSSLIVMKLALPRDGTDFPFTGSGPTAIDPFVLDVDPVDAPDPTNPSSIELTSLTPGTYHIAETLPAGWAMYDIVCTSNHSLSGTAVDVDIAATATELCVFQNYRPASITVRKRTLPAGGKGFGFSVLQTGDTFTLGDRGSRTITGLLPGEYTIDETNVPNGWAATGLTCTGTSRGDVDLAGGSVDIALAAGDRAVCTFTNTKLGTIQVVKRVEPATAAWPAGGFEFRTDDGPGEHLTSPKGVLEFHRLPGTYSVNEVVPDGWAADISCNAPVEVDPDPSTGLVHVPLAAGQVVRCVYTDVLLGGISVEKIATPDNAQDMPFDVTLGATKVVFVLDDDGNDVADPENGLLPNVASASGLRPGRYVIHDVVPEGWGFAGVRCTGAVKSVVTDNGAGALTIDLAGGEQVDCQFENVRSGPPTPPSTTVPPTDPTVPPGDLPATGSTRHTFPMAVELLLLGALLLLIARRPTRARRT